MDEDGPSLITSKKRRIDTQVDSAGLVGHPRWLTNRELNVFPSNYRPEENVKRSLYKCLMPIGRWNPEDSIKDTHHGGIFGMDFSTDGTVLGTACEKKSLLFFDTLTHKIINRAENAHSDCANAIKFLDSRLFASCSDDTTIKLWDFRFLRKPIRTLRGHANWVKNIEYLPSEGILLSSGFDHVVTSWDINSCHENQEEEFKRVFYTPGLVRMRVTKDESKMIISTQWGYMLVVHNFNVHTCAADLMGFKPNMYWLMIKADTTFASSDDHIKRFNAERNRAEIILDYPPGTEPENITSVTPHPQGWCVLSRNTNHEENSEWTCVHDIQQPTLEEWQSILKNRRSGTIDATPASQQEGNNFSVSSSASADLTASSSTSSGSTTPTLREDKPSARAVRLSPSDVDVSEAEIVRRLMSNQGMHHRYLSSRYMREPRAIFVRNSSPLNQTPNSRSTSAIVLLSSSTSASNAELLPKTYRRLTHFIDEPNVGRGFIKEQCFSADGRLIASPFAFGVRLLAFDQNCSQMCDTVPSNGEYPTPKKLFEVGTNVSHNYVVLSTAFSPTHYLLASGCLKGRVTFHQPVL